MNHNLATRVAARPLPKGGSPPALSSAALRAELRERGREFDALCREGVCRVVGSLRATPAPRMLFADIQRGRPASLTTIGAALACASRVPEAVPALDALADLLAAWVRGLAHQPDTGLLDAWSTETLAQGEADLAVAQALTAPCVGSIDRALASTARHIAAQQEMLVRLQTTRRRRAARGGLTLTGATQ